MPARIRVDQSSQTAEIKCAKVNSLGNGDSRTDGYTLFRPAYVGMIDPVENSINFNSARHRVSSALIERQQHYFGHCLGVGIGPKPRFKVQNNDLQ